MTSVELPVSTTPVLVPSSVEYTPQNPSRRLDYIDALRGFACLIVILCHTFGGYIPLPGKEHLPVQLLVIVSNLGRFVFSLFLALSGFCLYYPLVRKQPDLAISMNLRTYALRRGLRILPPYYLSIIVLVLLGLIGTHFAEHSALHSLAGLGHFKGIGDAVAHIFMVFNLNPQTIDSVNGAFWSLALEFQLYIVFPLLILLAARRSLRTVLVVTFLIALVWQIGVAHYLGFDMSATPIVMLTRMSWYYALPGRCFEFAAGMAAAALVARQQTHWRRPARLAIMALIVPSVLFFAKVSYFGPLITQAWGVICACLIFLMASVPANRFQDFIALRWLVQLGVISYTAYLIHTPILSLITPDRFHLNFSSDLIVIGFGVLQILVVIGIASITYRVIEEPFIRMSKAVGRRNRLAPEG